MYFCMDYLSDGTQDMLWDVYEHVNLLNCNYVKGSSMKVVRPKRHIVEGSELLGGCCESGHSSHLHRCKELSV